MSPHVFPLHVHVCDCAVDEVEDAEVVCDVEVDDVGEVVCDVDVVEDDEVVCGAVELPGQQNLTL